MTIKMYDYQLKATDEKNSQITICNWSRGLGKTYTLSAITLKERPEYVMYFGKTIESFKSIDDKIKEIFALNKQIKDSVIQYNFTKNKIVIKYFPGYDTTIYNWLSINNEEIEKYKSITYDYLMFDDLLPSENFQYKKVISMITFNNYDKQLESLYRLRAKIYNEDYTTGLNYGIYYQPELDKWEKDNYWFNYYAILDNPVKSKTDEVSFNEQIIINLAHELDSLTTKIQTTRNNNEFGTYKNLVLAYKEVLALYKDMTEPKKDSSFVYNLNFDIAHIDSDKTAITKQLISEAISKIKNELYTAK